MIRPRRKRTLLLVSIALAAMLLLAMGLSHVALQPGRATPWSWQREQQEITIDEELEIPGSQLVLAAFRVLFGIFVLLVPAGIIYVIISPTARKRIIRNLILAVCLMVILQRLGPFIANIIRQNVGDLGLGARSGEFDPSAFSADFLTNPPQWLVLASSILVAALIVAIPLGIAAFIRWQRIAKMGPVGELEELAAEAQQALASLRAGEDVRNTVLRCYVRMSQVLGQRRGLHREKAMTPHEFEMRLRQAGLPQGPVSQLTRLFEQVRYGAKVPGPDEEKQALESLHAIIRALEAAT